MTAEKAMKIALQLYLWYFRLSTPYTVISREAFLNKVIELLTEEQNSTSV